MSGVIKKMRAWAAQVTDANTPVVLPRGMEPPDLIRILDYGMSTYPSYTCVHVFMYARQCTRADNRGTVRAGKTEREYVRTYMHVCVHV